MKIFVLSSKKESQEKKDMMTGEKDRERERRYE